MKIRLRKRHQILGNIVDLEFFFKTSTLITLSLIQNQHFFILVNTPHSTLPLIKFSLEADTGALVCN